MKLYNTLSRKVEEFKPIVEGWVGIYSCGPTVYWNQHIGHMYAYTHYDALVRALRYLGFEVKWVMNITDVGHMTSDEDWGDDKMEKGAKREGATVWEVAERYINQFTNSLDLMNIMRPDILCRATDHIQDQIELIRKMEARGFTYRTQTGVVFDTGKFPGYADFARLKLDEQNAGSRVEVDSEKKKPWDFLLWVTNQPDHVMKWDSPWGIGFPGWHIECTAMSIKYLGESFDIHTGGKEHVAVHHTNEIAQGVGAFCHQTANYWLHNEWLTLKGEKVSKSSGNFITVQDLVAKGINPLALRYLYFNSNYRKGMDFTWESLDGAQTALERLYGLVSSYNLHEMIDDSGQVLRQAQDSARMTSDEEGWEKRFREALEDDLNMAKVMATVWEMVKSDLADGVKRELLLRWDRVLGLGLEKIKDQISKIKNGDEIPENVKRLAIERDEFRKAKRWAEADEVRTKIEEAGYEVKDTVDGQKVVKK